MGGGMVSDRAGLRIGELSRRSGVSVRNIREYQDRGLLPVPVRDGRVAFYDEEHVARLRLISRLLARGYTLNVIRDLLDAWAGGRDLHDVLGLEAVVSRPWGDDESLTLTRDEVAAVYRGAFGDEDVDRLVAIGVLVPDGDLYRCPSRRLLEAMPEMVDAGIPAQAGAAAVSRVKAHMDAVADDMVALVVHALLPEGTPRGLPEGKALVRLAGSIERLRLVAEVVAGSLFGLAMHRAIDEAVRLTTDRALRTGAHGDGERRSPTAS